jgi:hypothetical protein
LIRQQISDQVISGITKQLSIETNNLVKEVLVAAIGGIGLPEALPCLEMLIKTITGESSKNK